ncbi:hypothetical protein F9U64_19070 [Gracilibacillus oryzae]|uniref:Uncharacterized protein n=1 Tax=Gracilibacillus oryzae TaxID=1672701 RepID=A0A7C8KMX7_9BACI|nr:hypothetical protein F9U64_19070 [Gracilibacillus oryzae]
MEQKVDENLMEIKRYQQKINRLPNEEKVSRIYLLAKQLVFIGRLASIFGEEYKQIYAYRKRVYNETYLTAAKHRSATAELAVVDIRQQEAEAFGNFKRWSNAFTRTREEINALKYKVKIDIQDGSSHENY